MYILWANLSMNVVKKFMNNVWNFVSLPKLYYNEEVYFIILFKTKADRDIVLMRGPYTINHKHMFLHEWTPNFTLKNDVLGVLPIWVMFPQLPLVYLGRRVYERLQVSLESH